MDTDDQEISSKGFKAWLKRRPRWLKWTLVIIVPIIIIAGIVLSRQGNTEAVKVETAVVEKRDIEQAVVANGKLEPIDKQEFFTPEDSTLMELSVKVGDRVTKGQLLGRLDTMELARLYQEANSKLAGLEADLVRAEANNDQLNLQHAESVYTKAQNNINRISHLYQQGAVTIEAMEQAKVDYTQAEVDYRQAQLKARQGATAKEVASLEARVDLANQEVAKAKERLDLANFVAQEDGVVLFVGSQKGNRVLEGTQLLVVGSEHNLEVTANVNELDAGSLAVGQQVKITCTALPEREYQGEVIKVAAAAVSQQGSQSQTDSVYVPVTVKLLGDVSGLKPGYTVDLNIITMPKQDFLTVPFEALVDRQGQKIVYVIEGDLARECKVQTSKGNELYDRVVEGLKNGDKVILNPPANLKDGQRVITGGDKK